MFDAVGRINKALLCRHGQWKMLSSVGRQSSKYLLISSWPKGPEMNETIFSTLMLDSPVAWQGVCNPAVCMHVCCVCTYECMYTHINKILRFVFF